MSARDCFFVPIVFLTIDGIGTRTVARPKTVRQLLAALDMPEETALVARDQKLLTPDRQIWPGDCLWIRPTVSRG